MVHRQRFTEVAGISGLSWLLLLPLWRSLMLFTRYFWLSDFKHRVGLYFLHPKVGWGHVTSIVEWIVSGGDVSFWARSWNCITRSSRAISLLTWWQLFETMAAPLAWNYEWLPWTETSANLWHEQEIKLCYYNPVRHLGLLFPAASPLISWLK